MQMLWFTGHPEVSRHKKKNSSIDLSSIVYVHFYKLTHFINHLYWSCQVDRGRSVFVRILKKKISNSVNLYSTMTIAGITAL